MALDNPPFRSPAEIAVEFHTAVPSALFRSYLGSIAGAYSLTELIELTILDVSNRPLNDMSGIEYATSLSTLYTYSCGLETIGDLSNHTELSVLLMSNNTLAYIGDLSQLTKLNNLSLINNELVDVGDFSGLTLLQYCHLSNNQLTDIGDLSGLTSLRYFRIPTNQFQQAALEAIIDNLWGNRVALGALSCDIEMQDNPGSAGAAASKASEISDLIAAGCSVTIWP